MLKKKFKILCTWLYYRHISIFPHQSQLTGERKMVAMLRWTFFTRDDDNHPFNDKYHLVSRLSIESRDSTRKRVSTIHGIYR